MPVASPPPGERTGTPPGTAPPASTRSGLGRAMGWPAGAPSAPRRAITGAVAAAVGLGGASLVAAILPGGQSPLTSVGDEVVSLAPAGAREAAIGVLGTADKPAILVIVAALTLAAAAALGLLARRDRAPLAAGGAVLMALGIAATAAGAPSALPAVVTGSIVGALLAAWTVAGLTRVASPDPDWTPIPGGGRSGATEPVPPITWAEKEITRRQFALLAVAATALAAAGQTLASLLTSVSSSTVDAFRAAVHLPRVTHPLPPPAPGDQFALPGLTPLVTPNRSFYRIDTAFIAPAVDASSWTLRVDGSVRRALTLTYADLMAMPQEEAYVTLCCVSDPVSGNLIGNALWQGVRLDRLLGMAGVMDGADQVVGRSVDGFTAGFPTGLALDGRAALVAVGMNGQPLPIAHGFPARLVVPGLYGYVSATKWLTEITLTSFSALTGYWVERGWGPPAPVNTESRIDLPADGSTVGAGSVTVAGVAWAQHRGIRGVQVRVDGGPWSDAELAGELSIDTWRQWRFAWRATPGGHTLEARAVDSTGAPQAARQNPPFPDGATGYPSVTVSVA